MVDADGAIAVAIASILERVAVLAEPLIAEFENPIEFERSLDSISLEIPPASRTPIGEQALG